MSIRYTLFMYILYISRNDNLECTDKCAKFKTSMVKGSLVTIHNDKNFLVFYFIHVNAQST